MNYYNEFDPSAIAWLKELIKAGAIPDGHIDTRSIVDVQPEDLNGFDQCHFFAGIGGWSEALRLAGYAGIKGLWTGSCPCQPFSAAGKRKGTADARHLWPEMFRLVKHSSPQPQYVIGEQVEAAIRLGWLDGVFGDLEGEGYACGAAVLGAHSVGAPHIRQRLYWGGARRMEVSKGNGGDGALQPVQRKEVSGVVASSGGGSSGLEHAPNERRHERREPKATEIQGGRSIGSGEPALEGQGGIVSGRPEGLGADTGSGLEHPTSNRRDERRPEPSGRGASVRCGEGAVGGLEHAAREQVGVSGQPREQRDAGNYGVAEPHGEQRDGRGDAGPRGRGESTDGGRLGDPDDPRPQGYGPVVGERTGELSPWAASTTIYCADGKTRRISVEPALFPLAHGVPGRVGLLRGAGNAIVPQVAALFVTSFMESIECLQQSSQYQ